MVGSVCENTLGTPTTGESLNYTSPIAADDSDHLFLPDSCDNRTRSRVDSKLSNWARTRNSSQIVFQNRSILPK